MCEQDQHGHVGERQKKNKKKSKKNKGRNY